MSKNEEVGFASALRADGKDTLYVLLGRPEDTEGWCHARGVSPRSRRVIRVWRNPVVLRGVSGPVEVLTFASWADAPQGVRDEVAKSLAVINTTRVPLTHDAELERVYDDQGARVVVRRADDEIWIADELWASALDLDRVHVAGELEVDGDLIRFGVEGEGLGRLKYRRTGRGERWHVAVREYPPMTEIYRWFDHNGDVVSAPATTGRPTAYRWDDGLTHWMFGEPTTEPRIQAMTLCGKRALEVPGRGEVNCPECIEAAS